MEFLMGMGGAAIVGFLVYHGWKSWSDPPVVLGRQAAQMNWITSRYINRDGFRHMCVKRGGLEAMIVHDKAHVILLSPPQDKIFKDFIELEHWIAGNSAPVRAPGPASEKFGESTSDAPRLARFMEEVKQWPPDQAAAAGFIINSIIAKNGENLDPAFDELTVSQTEAVSEVVRELVGE